MRVLFAADVPPDPDSGAAGTEYQTILALRAQGHDVRALWAADLGRRIRHGNLHYLLELPRAYLRVLTAAHGEDRHDVLHVNQGHCFLAARRAFREHWPETFVFRSHGLDDRANAVLSFWAQRLGLPRRSWFKAIPGRLLERALDRHIDLACRYVSGVIVSSGLDAQFLIEHHGMAPARVACIPQAPAPRFVEQMPMPLTDARLRRVLFVGAEYWKGTHAVAAALAQLLAEDATLAATWVCAEESRPRVAALLPPAVLRRVTFPGWMPQDSVLGLYDRHGILLCPSLFEGFCKVFLEGMARAMCVIATPTGGMRDIIRDGDNGLIVPFHDPAALAAAVRRLLCSVPLAARMADSARRTAVEYSWSRTATETAAFYERLRGLPPRWAEA